MKIENVNDELNEKWTDVIEAFESSPPARGRLWILLTIISAIVFFVVFREFGSTQFAFVLLFVVAFHELGHYLVMRFYGMSDSTVFFVPLLGAAVLSKGLLTAQGLKKVYISMAGPLPGIFIGVLLYTLARDIEILRAVSLVLIILNGVNLLPLSIFDGAKIWNGLFFRRWPWTLLIFQILTLPVLYLFFGHWAICFLLMAFFEYLKSTSAIDIVAMLRERYPGKDWRKDSLTKPILIESLEFIAPGYRKRNDSGKFLIILSEVRELLKIESLSARLTLVLFGIYILAFAAVIAVLANEPSVLASLRRSLF